MDAAANICAIYQADVGFKKVSSVYPLRRAHFLICHLPNNLSPKWFGIGEFAMGLLSRPQEVHLLTAG